MSSTNGHVQSVKCEDNKSNEEMTTKICCANENEYGHDSNHHLNSSSSSGKYTNGNGVHLNNSSSNSNAKNTVPETADTLSPSKRLKEELLVSTNTSKLSDDGSDNGNDYDNDGDDDDDETIDQSSNGNASEGIQDGKEIDNLSKTHENLSTPNIAKRNGVHQTDIDPLLSRQESTPPPSTLGIDTIDNKKASIESKSSKLEIPKPDPSKAPLLNGIGEILPCLKPGSLNLDNPKENYSKFQEAQGNNDIIGDNFYYLVSCKWLKQFQEWANANISGESSVESSNEIPCPDAVDNKDLINVQKNKINVMIYEHADFEYVNETAWNLLMDWFGGGPELKRKAYSINESAYVDISGIEIKFLCSNDANIEFTGNFSKYTTAGELTKTLCQYLGIKNESSFRLWDYYDKKYHNIIAPASKTLAANLISNGQHVMIEFPDPITGEFAQASTRQQSTNVSLYESYNTNAVMNSIKPSSPGLVGLSNLGNTCFMNSILQCLSHTPPLRKYFISGKYKADINETNPLGMKGKLAKSFGDLMETMWGKKGEGDVVAPRGFKSTISEFKPEFAGYNQHDSQELLSFLLDGLHEDLNRIKNKPYTNGVEANGRPDPEIAAESLEIYKKRNDSYISDLYTGLFKSTVVCPVESCGNVSVTFDPYMCVQLPLSKESTPVHFVEVNVVDPKNWIYQEGKPIRVSVPKNSPCFVLRAKIAETIGVPVDDIFLVSVWNHKISDIISDFKVMERFSQYDKYFAYQDENASKSLLRIFCQETQEDPWYRQLRPYDLESKSTVDGCGWEIGDVWYGKYKTGNQERSVRVEVIDLTSNENDEVKVTCIFDYSIHHSDRELQQGSFYMEGTVKGKKSSASEQDNSVPADQFEEIEFKDSGWEGSYGPNITPGGLHIKGTIHPSGIFFIGKVLNKGCGHIHLTRLKKSDRPKWQPILSNKNSTDSKTLEFLNVEVAQVKFEGAPANYPPGVSIPYLITLPRSSTEKEVFSYLLKQFNKMAGVDIDSSENKDPLDLASCFTVSLQPEKSNSILEGRLIDAESDKLVFVDKHFEKLVVRWDWPKLHRTFVKENEITGLLELVDESEENSIHTLDDIMFGSKATLLRMEGEKRKKLRKRKVQANGGDKDGRLTPINDMEEEIEEIEIGDNEDEDDNYPGLTIDKCFDLFSREEQLSEMDMWYCSKCKDHKRAFKKMELWSVPPVLVLHLKRFSQHEYSHIVDKNTEEVRYRLEGLNLTKRVGCGDDKAIYDLIAVSNHFGGLGGGHYTAFARDLPLSGERATGKWYKFDDSSVSEVSSSHIIDSAAYLLFYIRRDFINIQ